MEGGEGRGKGSGEVRCFQSQPTTSATEVLTVYKILKLGEIFALQALLKEMLPNSKGPHCS